MRLKSYRVNRPLVFSNKDDRLLGPVSQPFIVHCLAGRKRTHTHTHYSQRVSHGVPGVVICSRHPSVSGDNGCALSCQISLVESSVWNGSAGLSWRDSPCHNFMSLLQTSLKRSIGRPAARRPKASWPYRMSLGMRPSSMRCTCPSQRIRRWQSMRCMLREPAFSSTAVLVILSCHVMPRIRRRQRRWKLSRRFSCLAYVVQDSLLYSRVLRTHA